MLAIFLIIYLFLMQQPIVEGETRFVDNHAKIAVFVIIGIVCDLFMYGHIILLIFTK